MDKFNAHISVEMYSQYTKTVPIVCVKFADNIIWHGPITDTKILKINTPDLPAQNYWLSVIFENKDDSEQELFKKDMMVGIRSVQVQGYNHEFSLYSEYEPVYPELWYQEQKNSGLEPPKIIHSNYLGWSGEWRLQIGLPIYRWIHVKTGQGWLI